MLVRALRCKPLGYEFDSASQLCWCYFVPYVVATLSYVPHVTSTETKQLYRSGSNPNQTVHEMVFIFYFISLSSGCFLNFLYQLHNSGRKGRTLHNHVPLSFTRRLRFHHAILLMIITSDI